MEKYGLLFESIFKRKLTDENAVGYLENIAKEHPYFSIAQFYLLQLLQKDVTGYKTQAKKTAVLFNNNHWLNFQLIEAGHNNKVAETLASPAPVETVSQHFADKIFEEEKPVEEAAITEKTPIEEEKISAVETETTKIETDKGIGIAPVNEISEYETTEENITGTEAFKKESIQVAEEKIATVESEIIQAEKEKAIVVENEIPVIQIIEEAETPLLEKAEKNIVSDTQSNVKIETNEIVSEAETITAIVDLPTKEEIAAKPNAEPVVANEPLLFEPLHTTDYFASVGIKLSEEEKASGKLGKQLMSFTEWLKTMRKVHTAQLPQATAPVEVETANAETNIQKLAEKSNQENDVVTEAMAEVLLQQGRQGKALEILEKLSLLNPSKSAYFAAKINQIKVK